MSRFNCKISKTFKGMVVEVIHGSNRKLLLVSLDRKYSVFISEKKFYTYMENG